MNRKVEIMEQLLRVFAENDCTQLEISQLCTDLYYVSLRAMKIPNGDYTDIVTDFYEYRKNRTQEQAQTQD